MALGKDEVSNDMILVTGAAGFIGSNLIWGLNRAGERDIVAVDDLSQGEKYRNLQLGEIADYWDKDKFRWFIEQNRAFSPKLTAVFHQGACTDTTEWNGKLMMETNFEYSKLLLNYCLHHRIPLIYASSAAVYGLSRHTHEDQESQALNVYGYSKLLFDRYWQRHFPQPSSPVVGLRYFNVYGPGETHKGKMASLVLQWRRQLLQTGTIKLFGEYDGFAAGEQRRDFIHVNDVVAVNLWALNSGLSGIFNVGTGNSRTFNELANCLLAHYGQGECRYIPFPDNLRGAYQSHTQANLTRLRQAGYQQEFMPLELGVQSYLSWLDAEGVI